jgi:hypothetical protein
MTNASWNPMKQAPEPATLADFLLARVAEDEAAAGDAFYEGQHWYAEEEGVSRWPGDDTVWDADRKRDAQHVVRWQPARVLAECEAKRRIVELDWRGDDSGPAQLLQEDVLRLLALSYADHPDYRQEWRP